MIFQFPLGLPDKIDQQRGSLALDLVLDLAFDKEFFKVISIDFIDALQQRINPNYIKGANITPQLFHTVVLPKLAKIALQRLKELSSAFKNIQEQDLHFLTNFLMQSTPFDSLIEAKGFPSEIVRITNDLRKRDISDVMQDVAYAAGLENLIAQKLYYIHERNKWVKETFHDKQDQTMLSDCTHAITHVLKRFLLKKCGSHYGRDPDPCKYVVRPYRLGKPNPTIFSHFIEQVIGSAMTLLYYRIHPNGLQKMLKKLQKQAKDEMSMSSSCPLLRTDAYKKFESLLGEQEAKQYHFFHLSRDIIDAFGFKVNKDYASFKEFIKENVFGQIAIYKTSLTSAPPTLAGRNKHVLGYTGTLSKGTLPVPWKLKWIPEQAAQQSLPYNEKWIQESRNSKSYPTP